MGIRNLGLVAAIAIGFFAADDASATTILFNGMTHGQVITEAAGVTISATSNTNIAAIFNSDERGTLDRDLEGPDLGGDGIWDAGNLSFDTYLGGMLIIQEDSTGCGDGICDNPDDEGSRPGGVLAFVFQSSIMDFGFDIIDVEGTLAEEGEIRFFTDAAGTNQVAAVSFADFSDNSSAHYDPTVIWGNNTANRLPVITPTSLGLDGADAQWLRVEIHMGGSGAVDNVFFASAPEPSTALMLGTGLLALAARRRSA